jgi:hypothetical protein
MNNEDAVFWFATVAAVGLLMFFLGGIVGTIAPVWHRATPAGGCVPGNAINYDGHLGAWLGRDGAVILLADQEDTYQFCTRP